METDRLMNCTISPMNCSADPLLIARESAAILQVSVPTFWRRVADGTIPKPVKLGGLSRWPRSEILGVIEAAKAARTVA
jgi:predicted DNA-binding transcriptional regulator AlpA